MKLINDYQIFQCEICGRCFFTSREAKRHESNHIKRIKKASLDPEKSLGIPLFREASPEKI
jgi:hypothetical protein